MSLVSGLCFPDKVLGWRSRLLICKGNHKPTTSQHSVVLTTWKVEDGMYTLDGHVTSRVLNALKTLALALVTCPH